MTWIDSDMTEDYMKEYENREAFLSETGFEGGIPMYQYYDRYHNLRLELYMDESAERFCGLVYGYYFNSDRKNVWTGMDLSKTAWENGTGREILPFR